MSQLTNSYPFPVLEDDRDDYTKESSYEVSQVDGDKNSQYIVLEHKLSGNNFISQLLEDGTAKFITTIVLKSSMYRETLDNVEVINKFNVRQKIPLKTTFETQNFFSSIVYIGEDKEVVLNSKLMGLDDFWNGTIIKLSKGSIIARDGWKELESTASDLLTINRNENLKYGFDVEIYPNEGGKFVANMNAELYDTIRIMSLKDSHRRSVMIHVLCVGFMKLYQEYKEDDSILTNFKGIKQELENSNIKTWSDDDFNPNQVACKFLPHKIEISGDDNE